MMIKKVIFLICILFLTAISFSQTDTATSRGTIKIAKQKPSEIYIKAICNFNKYNIPDSKVGVSKDQVFQPFPVVDGYPYPFNYTKYFNDCFKTKEIDLKGKLNDTVVLEVKILENGKVYIKDKSPTIMLKGYAATYDDKTGTYEINNLHMNCLKFMRQANKWIPGYYICPKKGKYRGEVVVKPNKNNLDVTGTVTIYFSTTPFED